MVGFSQQQPRHLADEAHDPDPTCSSQHRDLAVRERPRGEAAGTSLQGLLASTHEAVHLGDDLVFFSRQQSVRSRLQCHARPKNTTAKSQCRSQKEDYTGARPHF